MNPSGILLRFVALPIAVCAVAACLGWVVGRRSTRGRDAILGVGVAAAFIAAMFALGLGPNFPLMPSEDGWLWIVWIAAAGAIVGVFETFVRAPSVVKTLVRVALAFGVVKLLFDPVMPYGFGSYYSDRFHIPIVAVALATIGLWIVLADPGTRASRVSSVVPILVALPATAGILVAYGHSFKLGMASGALGIAVGATAVLSWPRKTSSLLPAAMAAVIAPVFVGILASAYLYLNYGETIAIPFTVALLLFASAACSVARSWKIALILAVLFAGGAAVVAAVNDAKNGPSTYDWI